jgi:AraC-like DNA-binding protein
MPFIEFEKSIRKNDWSMHDLHSHPHYEIYFLTKGSREFFLSDALYKVTAPVLIVIPPHVMHKTEGDAFERYNVNVEEGYLDPYQKEVLETQALRIAQLSTAETERLSALLNNAIEANGRQKHAAHIVHALFSYCVYLLDTLQNTDVLPNATAQNDIPPLVLKIVDYLHEHYADKLTLQTISDNFFVSKATLLYNFKKYTNCSPIDFLLNIRLTKAKEWLSKSELSVNEIAERCGFSSANYFGLIFKQKEGISPLRYRKNQREKQ